MKLSFLLTALTIVSLTACGSNTSSGTNDGNFYGKAEICYESRAYYCEDADEAEVIATDENGDVFSVPVQSDGQYSLNVPPGIYHLLATLGYMDIEEHFEVAVKEGESVEVDFTAVETMDAPYIYLYPETTQEIDVILNLGEGIEITHSDPPYTSGWHVTAEPSGLIDETYDYLFYESTIYDNMQNQTGWAVEEEQIFTWFQQHLPQMGLNTEETQDFLAPLMRHAPKQAV